MALYFSDAGLIMTLDETLGKNLGKTLGETVLVTETGSERLSRSPLDLVFG